jgi:hypothetical protein
MIPIVVGLIATLCTVPLSVSWSLTDSVGTAFMIEEDAVYSRAWFEQKWPAVASDGVTQLVVWSDSRRSFAYDLFGTRVAASGAIIDSAAIAIAVAGGNQKRPAAAFGDTSYLIVWTDTRYSSLDIFATRVGTGGEVHDPDGISISEAADYQDAPAVAFDGTNYLVVWQDRRSGNYDIYGARVTPGGDVLDTAGIPIATDADSEEYPAVAFDGTNYLVVWQDDQGTGDIYGARVATDGSVLDPTGMPVCTAGYRQYQPAVAFDGANYFVVWRDERGSDDDIYGARLTPGGVLLDPIALAICTEERDQTTPAITFDDSVYVVAWLERIITIYYDVYATRVDLDGTVLDPPGIFLASVIKEQTRPGVAYDGTNFVVVWDDDTDPNYDVYAGRIAPDGSLLDQEGTCVSVSASTQFFPAVTFGYSDYFVVWQDQRDDPVEGWNICGALVDPTYGPLDSAVAIVADGLEYSLFHPAVDFDGINYVVVWEDSRYDIGGDAFGARVGMNGTVLDPGGFPIRATAENQQNPRVAGGHEISLVVWSEADPDEPSAGEEIWGARLSSDGTVLDPDGILIGSAVGNQINPAVANGGDSFLVAWQDHRSGEYDIYATVVDIAGAVLDTSGAPVCDAAGNQLQPEAAFDGTNYLVVWEDLRGSAPDIYGARVTGQGSLVEPSAIQISTAWSSQVEPAVAFDGTAYLVAWADRRTGTNYDIYGARVSTGGVVSDPAGMAIEASSADEYSPGLAAGGPGSFLAAYYRYTPPAYDAHRIWANFIQPEAAVKPDENRIAGQMGRIERIVPNPITGSAQISYVLPDRGHVRLAVFDVTGRLAAEIVNEIQDPGYHALSWKVSDAGGSPLAPGLYFCHLKAAAFTDTRKIMILK